MHLLAPRLSIASTECTHFLAPRLQPFDEIIHRVDGIHPPSRPTVATTQWNYPSFRHNSPIFSPRGCNHSTKWSIVSAFWLKRLLVRFRPPFAIDELWRPTVLPCWQLPLRPRSRPKRLGGQCRRLQQLWRVLSFALMLPCLAVTLRHGQERRARPSTMMATLPGCWRRCGLREPLRESARRRDGGQQNRLLLRLYLLRQRRKTERPASIATLGSPQSQSPPLLQSQGRMQPCCHLRSLRSCTRRPHCQILWATQCYHGLATPQAKSSCQAVLTHLRSRALRVTPPSPKDATKSATQVPPLRQPRSRSGRVVTKTVRGPSPKPSRRAIFAPGDRKATSASSASRWVSDAELQSHLELGIHILFITVLVASLSSLAWPGLTSHSAAASSQGHSSLCQLTQLRSRLVFALITSYFIFLARGLLRAPAAPAALLRAPTAPAAVCFAPCGYHVDFIKKVSLCAAGEPCSLEKRSIVSAEFIHLLAPRLPPFDEMIHRVGKICASSRPTVATIRRNDPSCRRNHFDEKSHSVGPAACDVKTTRLIFKISRFFPFRVSPHELCSVLASK